MKHFILNDQTKTNSYGFKVDNATLDCERFNANSVLLYMHKRGEVHGRWEDLKFDGPLYMGVPVIDIEDSESKKLGGKIDRGFLRAASLYLNFTDKTHFIETEEGELLLRHAEVFEASIVDIPSNANSVCLFAGGKLLSDAEVKGIMLSAGSNFNVEKTKQNNKQKTSTMEKFKLSAQAIAVIVGAGLMAGETEAEVNDAIVKLGAALSAEKTAHSLEKKQREALEEQIKQANMAALTALVDQAVNDGKIVVTAKESFIALGLDTAKTIIENLPGKVSLGAQVNNPANGALAGDPKTFDEFEKLSNEAKLAFKNNNPGGYAALFA